MLKRTNQSIVPVTSQGQAFQVIRASNPPLAEVFVFADGSCILKKAGHKEVKLFPDQEELMKEARKLAPVEGIELKAL